jgi:IPT/TIG domain
MRLSSVTFYLFILGSVFQCKEQEVTGRNYPRLLTREVTGISKAGATFHGDIIYRGNSEILEYGFVWLYEDPTIENGERIYFRTSPNSNPFATEVTARHFEGQQYKVRAYVITKDHIVYGNTVDFVSQGSLGAVIDDFYPKTARLTDTVTIVGKYFSRTPALNYILFGEKLADNVVFATDTLLRVLVPEDLIQPQAVISVSSGGSHPTPFTLIAPAVLSVTPTAIRTCDTLVISMIGLGPSVPVDGRINSIHCEYIGRTNDQLFLRVPYLNSPGNPLYPQLQVGLFVTTITETLIYTPSGISSVEPSLASYLDTLTIHFLNKPSCDLRIFIDGNELPILESSGDFVRVVVPGQLSDPAYNYVISVRVGEMAMPGYLKDRSLTLFSVTPSSGSPGELVTIKGLGFHPVLANNVVCFNCQGTASGNYGQIVSGNTRELVVRIPAIPPNQIGISVFVQNKAILNYPFEIQ